MADDLFGDFEMLSPQELAVQEEIQTPTGDPIPDSIVETGSEPVIEKPESFLLNPKDLNPGGNEITNPNGPTDSEKLSAFAKMLADEGLIDLKDDMEFKSSKDLVGLADQSINSRAEKQLDNWKKTLTPKQQQAVGLIEEGIFNDDNMNYASKLDEYKKIDPATVDDLDFKKNTVKEFYKFKGLSDAKAEKIAQRMVESDDIEEEFVSSVTALKSGYESKINTVKQQQKTEAIRVETERRKNFDSLIKSIDEADHIVDGIPLTTKQKEALKDSFTTPAGTDVNGNALSAVMAQRAKNPVAFEKALHYYTMLGLFNTDNDGNFKPDLSQIKAVSRTKATNELDQLLSSNSNSPLTGGAQVLDKDKQSNLLGNLEKMFSK